MSEEGSMMDPQDALTKLRALADENESKPLETAGSGATAPAVSEEPAEEPKSFIQRVRSGKITGDDIPEGIREDWVRSILGGNPFSYGVPVLGGKVLFVFQELDNDAAKFLRKMNETLPDSVESQVKLAILMYLNRVEGAFDLEQKVGAELMEDKRVSLLPSQKIDEAYDNLCAALPQGLVRFLVGAWGIYSTLVGILTDDAFPDSF